MDIDQRPLHHSRVDARQSLCTVHARLGPLVCQDVLPGRGACLHDLTP